MKRLLLAIAILCTIGTFFLFDLSQYLTLDTLKLHQADLEAYRNTHPLMTSAIYVAVYITVAALSLPGATIMTLSGGAIFGLVWGTVLANIAASIGATLAFLSARFIFGESVERRFEQQISTLNRGIEKDGAFYLFSLRLVPAVPFFIINVVMGLTRLRVWTFFWVSALGMLGGAAVYANAGTQLAQIERLADIASPELILSFVLLGLFPITVRKLLTWAKTKRRRQAPKTK